MFSLFHIIFLAVTLPVTVGLAIFVGKKWGWNKWVLYVCVGICIVSELTKITYLVLTEGGSYVVNDAGNNEWSYYLLQRHLPFNLCSIQIIFIFIITFATASKLTKPLLAFMYPTMLGGGIMALLIPTSSVNHGWFTPISFQFWIFHAMLIFLALYIIITKYKELNMKSYFTALVMLAGTLIFAIYINAILGGAETGVNFFFVARPPMENIPILNFNNGWVVYILNLTWLAILLTSLCYIPIFVRAIRQRIRAKQISPTTTQE